MDAGKGGHNKTVNLTSVASARALITRGKDVINKLFLDR